MCVSVDSDHYLNDGSYNNILLKVDRCINGSYALTSALNHDVHSVLGYTTYTV